MKTSESIKEIAGALCKMQAALRPADKENTNPMYKSKYSDINSVWGTLREPLTSNGLSVWQDATTSDTGVSIITRVVHLSGEWIEFGPFVVPLGAKKDAHGFGSCCTYAKKYSLCAALGITSSDDDDDGNAACAPAKQQLSTQTKTAVPNDITPDEALKRLGDYKGDCVQILLFLQDRCSKFKTRLDDEIESFKSKN
jgi:hypothetical protein